MSKSNRPGIRRIDSNTYRVRVTMTDPTTGKRREADRIVTAASIQEAVRAQVALRDELARAAEPKAERVTVEAYARRWLERRQAAVRYSTAVRYGEHLDKMIEALGDLYMDALTPKHIIDWLDAMAARYSGYTCLGALRVARVMTKDAEVELGLAKWPCNGVKRPKKVNHYTSKEPNALTASQLSALFEVMRATEPRVFPLFALMAYTGMRFGEASALEWGDFDFEVGTITIDRSQYRGVRGDPKTDDSRRNVPLVPELAEILREHRSAMVREQHPGVQSGLAFPSSVGRYQDNSDVNKAIRRAKERAGIGIRITAHGLRRTLNTLALQVAPGEVVRKVIGHTQAAMTEHYLNVGMDAKRDLVQRTVQLVRPNPTPCGDSSGDREVAS